MTWTQSKVTKVPTLINKERGIVICYLEENEAFVCDPTMTHTICIGSTRSGKSQTVVLPTIEQISRQPIPTFNEIFKELNVDVPKNSQDQPDFKSIDVKRNLSEYKD